MRQRGPEAFERLGGSQALLQQPQQQREEQEQQDAAHAVQDGHDGRQRLPDHEQVEMLGSRLRHGAHFLDYGIAIRLNSMQALPKHGGTKARFAGRHSCNGAEWL